MKTTKTLTARHTKRNNECPIEQSYSTRVKIALAPAAARHFTDAEMDAAGKGALLAALDLARAFLLAVPAGARYCLPDVAGGEVWAGGASAWVTIEHDGDPQLVPIVERVIEQARK